MLNLSNKPGEVVPYCLDEAEFKIPPEIMYTGHHDTFSPSGIGENYHNYWLGVAYWSQALKENRREAFEYLEPIPMKYSDYIRNLHPECPITAGNIYTIAALDALCEEATAVFSSDRKWDLKTVEDLYMKARFLITGRRDAPHDTEQDKQA